MLLSLYIRTAWMLLFLLSYSQAEAVKMDGLRIPDACNAEPAKIRTCSIGDNKLIEIVDKNKKLQQIGILDKNISFDLAGAKNTPEDYKSDDDEKKQCISSKNILFKSPHPLGKATNSRRKKAKTLKLNKKAKVTSKSPNSVTSIENASSTTLAEDAFSIQAASEDLNSRDVVLCVALRHESNIVKKFAFSNERGQMAPKMFAEAVKRGYDPIDSEQAHAEGEFLQFLFNRVISREPGSAPPYTHIMGMGCSRQHCGECDSVLKHLLGEQYYEVTAAAETIEETFKIDDSNKKAGIFEIQATRKVQIVEKQKACALVKNKKTGKKEPSKHLRYYLPASLKEWLRLQLGYSKINEWGDKYTQ